MDLPRGLERTLRSLRSIYGLVLLVAIVLVAALALGGASALGTIVDDITGTSESDSLNETKLRRELHAEVNEERKERGLEPFSYSSELTEVAEFHSEQMANKSFFAHVSPSDVRPEDRYDRFNVDCAGGENIYRSPDVQSADDETTFAEAVVASWMDSPGHRRNILREHWHSEGFGIAIGELDGQRNIFITQNYC